VSRRSLALVVVALLTQGCAVNGLSFSQDDRVDIQAPTTNATVRLPFEVRWTATDFDGRYAVFFDRTPMRPDQPLRSLVSTNDPCRARRGCPDAAWLADRSIFVTAETSIRIEDLPEERSTSRAKDRHELTIVLLDDDGRRSGESAFIREFIVDREDR
jgi:hypothetical protein